MTTFDLLRGTGAKDRSVVLIGDDNDSFRAVLSEMLEAAGYGVVEASDGEEVVVVARRIPLRLMLLDVKMPKFSGIDAYRVVVTEGRVTPAVFLTTGPAPTLAQQARVLGAVAMLDKLSLRPDDFCKLVFAITHGGPLTDLKGLVGWLLNPLSPPPHHPSPPPFDSPEPPDSRSAVDNSTTP